MKFSASQIAEAYRFYARRRGISEEPNETAIAAAVTYAEGLNADECDEPAALLYAFSRHPRCFPGALRAMTQHVCRTRAQQRGYVVRISADEFDKAIFAAMQRRATYEQIRGWMTTRLERQ